MAKAKDVNAPGEVSAFLKGLEPSLAQLVQEIRDIVLAVDTNIGEQIKWNSPAFFYKGEMKAFNPKEYKRDLLVINLHRGNPLLVFPTGASIKDDSGVLEGDYKDGRRMINISDAADLKAKKKALKAVILAWLKQIE